ncbi:hypothetical protein [Micromonospora sp. RP3T]|uniref:hypothetical protein n=1 Tax=Micromonospora sp. RP3T TaxID=2135446 RepID=UPI003D740A08
MADDTNKPRPGDAPGALRTGEDGSLPDLTGRRLAWIWMQDTDEGGGGRFDVLATRVDVWLRKGARVVPNYPVHFGPSGRLARPRTDLRQLTGDGAPSEQTGPTVTDGAPPAEGEPDAGDPTLAQPASTLGAVEPADDRQPDTTPDTDGGQPAADDPTLAEPASTLGAVEPARLTAADTEPPAAAGDSTDADGGQPAAAKTTTKRSGRR